MKTYIKTLLLTFSALLVATGCNEFAVENLNPDATLNISNNPELLLTGVIREPATRMVGAGWSEGNLMAQYGARFVFTSFDLFDWGAQSGHWNQLYLSARDAQELYTIASASGNKSYQGVALIMKSWMFQILTDLWGDVPYSEALKGRADEPVFKPVYDAQADIYAGLIADLRMANELLSDPALSAIKGDILFEGDLNRWRSFGNSLLLRVYLRLSEVEPSLAAQGISEIYGNPNGFPVMIDNSDNAALTFLSQAPNAYPIAAVSGYRIGSFNEYRMSETVQTVLQNLDDPRISNWFAPTANSVTAGDPVYDGMRNGIVDGPAYIYKGGDAFLSKFADKFHFEPNAIQSVLMQYAEVEFIWAEAAQRGWISADAQSHYEAGIIASFAYWNTELPSDYLSRAGVAYDGSLKQIATQKWLALFNTDFQGFCEYKRTGFPSEIQPGPDAFLDVYPSRFLYPSAEQALNADNRQAAIDRQGPDAISTRVWWEGN
ncbi:MAG: SusD/RagB family nutrient-binding outer membrane lipoprotein [Bacteroidetes bacterium]|nr:MAG: SusD/RagB family nutrient-binding outer membrane lipoprotein [Bacteroidota bacterium]